MIKFAPSILLSVLLCSDKATVFNAVQPVAVWNVSTWHSITNNDFEVDYTAKADRQDNVEIVSAIKLSHRAALTKFAAMTTGETTFFAGN